MCYSRFAVVNMMICYERLTLFFSFFPFFFFFFFLFMYCYFILLFIFLYSPPPPRPRFVYGSVAFTINHVSVSVSLSISLVYGNAFAQFRMGVSQINVHQHRFSPTARSVACPFCVEEKEPEINILLEYPVCVFLRHKYLPDKVSAHDNRSHFLSLMNSKSQQTVFNAAKFLLCAFNLRTSKVEVPS